MGEVFGAEQACEQAALINLRVSLGINSISRDVSAEDHERGYQALGMFLLPAIWKFVACEVAALEIQPTEAVVFHLSPSYPISNRTMMFLISRQCHMMW